MTIATGFWLTTIVIGSILAFVVHLMIEDSKRGEE